MQMFQTSKGVGPDAATPGSARPRAPASWWRWGVALRRRLARLLGQRWAGRRTTRAPRIIESLAGRLRGRGAAAIARRGSGYGLFAVPGLVPRDGPRLSALARPPPTPPWPPPPPRPSPARPARPSPVDDAGRGRRRPGLGGPGAPARLRAAAPGRRPTPPRHAPPGPSAAARRPHLRRRPRRRRGPATSAGGAGAPPPPAGRARRRRRTLRRRPPGATAASARVARPAQPHATRPSSAGVTRAGWLGTIRTVTP